MFKALAEKKKVIAIVLLLVGCLLFKNQIVNFAKSFSPRQRLIGRWEQVPRQYSMMNRWYNIPDFGYIFFYENGWMRSDVLGKKSDGQFQVQKGSILFTVTSETIAEKIDFKYIRNEMWISDYAIEGDKMKINISNIWIEFQKSPEQR
jgi:hypothetical protein